MSNPTNEFQDLWKAGYQNDNRVKTNLMLQSITEGVRGPQQETISAQVGTIIILSVLVVVLFLFFQYLSPVQESLSILGKGLMIVSILVRISVEVYGFFMAKKIDLFESVTSFVQKSRAYVRFRHRVHSFMVITTFIVYSVGYYMLIPEWSTYFSESIIWLLIVGYLFIMAAVIFLAIRPGMRKEKEALEELERLAAEMKEG